METLFSYLEKVTGVNNLENRSWQDVVDNVILPMMAYPANQRNRIGNAFMKFMAEFTQDVCRKDEHLGEIMLEIAMQRISDGAVLHPDDPTPTFEALPQAYRTYGSQNGYLGGEPGLMGKECEDFIVNALPVCLEHAKTRSHAGNRFRPGTLPERRWRRTGRLYAGYRDLRSERQTALHPCQAMGRKVCRRGNHFPPLRSAEPMAQTHHLVCRAGKSWQNELEKILCCNPALWGKKLFQTLTKYVSRA